MPQNADPQADPGTDAQARRIPLARPGRGAGAARTAEMLRVDHAGEYAAVLIYRAQRAVFEARRGREALAADMGRMEAEEQVHLDRFNALLNERRVRPTVMTPLWRLAASALGAGTALIGEKAAHACTEAVESVIGEHYEDQIAEIADRDPELAAVFQQFRDDELAHHDHAIEQGAHEAPAYPLLSAVIKAGCKAAIRISERV